MHVTTPAPPQEGNLDVLLRKKWVVLRLYHESGFFSRGDAEFAEEFRDVSRDSSASFAPLRETHKKAT